ncbi:hypothetical protein KDK95_21075 [Actinospica sp. MGRD01-02]|uniref:DUF1616 domain-containing protein n=1 Tax=Actinospica acidithermotolerans TaxID=2828514 RepID=A0A941E9N9_9ACTN|nr:hypothetical protein [Actinospica acidithermotolerans]MBR7828815.1 hypothetical protein [Actinospica acidithermotolerans]
MTPQRLTLAASGWIALAATALPEGSPLRALIAVAFMLVCPGAALVRLGNAALTRRGRPMDRLEAGVLAVTLSLAVGALVSEAFFITHTYTLTRTTIVLAAITSVAALWPVPRRPLKTTARAERPGKPGLLHVPPRAPAARHR